jgi:hypothetical protein
MNMERWRWGAVVCLMLCGMAAAGTAARADVATWNKPGMDVWTYPSPLQPGVRTLGPTFLTSPGLDENDQFLPSSSRDPSRRGMSFAVFDTSTSITKGLPTSNYEISSVTVTFTMQESTAGSIFYDDTPDTNAELLADYVNNDIDTERPMELYGLALNAGYTGFNFGSGGGGEQPFVETVFPYSPTGAEGVLIAYPIAADEAGEYVDVSNSMTGGYSATAEDNLTAPFDPVPWSIGKVPGLANGDLIPENTTFTFTLDLELPGVAEYVQQSLADGALGFYLSSNHFAGDPHNGSTIPYPQWYHKEFHAAFGGVPPTLAVEYAINDSPSELPGDYNTDGVVDAADYTVWRDSLESATALPNDDTPGVGADDFTRWRANFGNVLGSGGGALAVAVPEPATWCGALVVAWAVGLVRRRKG